MHWDLGARVGFKVCPCLPRGVSSFTEDVLGLCISYCQC